MRVKNLYWLACCGGFLIAFILGRNAESVSFLVGAAIIGAMDDLTPKSP